MVYDELNAPSYPDLGISIQNTDISSNEDLFLRSPRSLIQNRNELCATCGCWHPRVAAASTGRTHSHSEQLPGTLPGCTLINIFRSIVKVDSVNLNDVTKEKNPLPNYSEADLFLLNQFISHTWETMTTSPDDNVRHVWAQVVPTLSMAHPLLLHSMLAVTAAHLSHTPVGLEPEHRLRTDLVELRKLEEKHFKEAMNCVGREILSGIDELSCHAFFVATSVFVLYLVSPRRHPISIPSTSDDISASILDVPLTLDTTWSSFIRAVYGALQHSWTWLARGPVALLVDNLPPPRTSTHTLSHKAESMLARLNLLCSDFNILGPDSAMEMGDRSTASAYYDAVWNIRMAWAVLEWYCASVHLKNSFTGQLKSSQDVLNDGSPLLPVDSAEVLCALFQFVLHTPSRFWERLESASPRALIIYSYYSVCWEAMSYDRKRLPLRVSTMCPHDGEKNDPERDDHAWHWWTQGRAEADLKCIELQLDFVSRSEYERGVYKQWINGAWDVYRQLRQGFWFENEERC